MKNISFPFLIFSLPFSLSKRETKMLGDEFAYRFSVLFFFFIPFVSCIKYVYCIVIYIAFTLIEFTASNTKYFSSSIGSPAFLVKYTRNQFTHHDYYELTRRTNNKFCGSSRNSSHTKEKKKTVFRFSQSHFQAFVFSVLIYSVFFFLVNNISLFSLVRSLSRSLSNCI